MRNIFSSTKIQAKDLNPDADLQYGPFDVMSPTLSTFNRELWLSGRMQVNVNQSFSGKFEFLKFSPEILFEFDLVNMCMVQDGQKIVGRE